MVHCLLRSLLTFAFSLDYIYCRPARTKNSNHDGVWLTPHRAENDGTGPGLDDEDCESVLIELYNMADHKTDSIDRFTPVALGALKLNLSDIRLADCCSQRGLDCANNDLHGSITRVEDTIESDTRACDRVPEIQLCTTLDRWIGGKVSPPQREGSPEAYFDVAVRLECRNFKGHGRCGVVER